MTGAVVTTALVLAASRPQLSLVAEPARVQLEGSGTATVRVANHGSTPIVVDAQRAGFALDLRGRPQIVTAARAAWLSVSPKRVAVAAGQTATLTVTGRVARGAAPGDHVSLLLLASRQLTSSAVSVRIRLGVLVVLRVPGRVVHRLVALGASSRRVGRVRRVTVRFANRGNVTELVGGRVVVTLWRHGRRIAQLGARLQSLLPHTAGLVDVVYRGSARGPVVCRVGGQPSGPRFRLVL